MSENYSFRSSMNGFNRNDVIAYIDNLIREKTELEEQVARLREEISGLNSTNDTLRGIIVDETKKGEEVNKCDECDIAKVYEARFGAAMLDAKRFSEILVQEANEKVSELFSNACKSADDTLTKAKEISQNIEEITKSFNQSFSALGDNLKAIEESVSAFKAQTAQKNASVDNTVDFLSLNSTVKAAKPNADATASADVNFDDADDFEIKVNI